MRNSKALGDQIGHASTWRAIFARLCTCIQHVYGTHFRPRSENFSLASKEVQLSFTFPLAKVKIKRLTADMSVKK